MSEGGTQRVVGSGGTGLAVLCLVAVLLPGCSLRQMAVESLADTLAESGSVYASDPDPQLVAEALPFALKTIETLLAEAPDHRGLLLAAARGFTQYAYGFVQLPAEEIEATDYRRAEQMRDRALGLYLRARDYGLRGLAVEHPGIDERLRQAPQEAVEALERADVALTYWTGAAWGAALGVGMDRPELLADLGAVRALLLRALELDADYDKGAIHEALISLAAALPPMLGGSLDEARRHFERAVELSGGQRAGPYVTYAEAVGVRTQDRALFEDMLTRALAVDPDRVPEERLNNLLLQEKARRLLAQSDELFLDATGDEEPTAPVSEGGG